MGEEGAGFAGVPGDVGGEEDALGVLGLQVGVVERDGLLLVDVDADAGRPSSTARTRSASTAMPPRPVLTR